MRHAVPVAALAATALTAGCTPSPDPAPPGSSARPAPAAAAVDHATWEGGRSTPVADPLYPERGNPGLDVLHYDLQLDWAPAAKALTGTAVLRIRPTADAPRLSLDFTGLTVDRVMLDGAAVTGTVCGEKLTVAAPVVADRPVTLVVTYHGTPEPVPMPSRRGDAGEGLGLRATKAAPTRWRRTW